MHEVVVGVVGDDDGVVVVGGLEDEAAIVGHGQALVDVARRRVGQVAAALELVERVGGERVVDGLVAPKAWHERLDLGVAARHKELDGELDAAHREVRAHLVAVPTTTNRQDKNK